MTETQLAHPLLTLTVLAPGLAGLIIARLPDPRWVRRISLGTAGLTLLLALVAAARCFALAPGGLVVDPLTFALVGPPRPLFGIDSLSAILLPFFALLGLVVLVAAPRRELDSAGVATLLVIEGATLGLYAALDLGLVGLLFLLELAPVALLLARRARAGGDPGPLRVFTLYLLTAALLLGIAIACIGRSAAHAGLASPLYLPELARHPFPGAHALQYGIVGLLAVAVLIRKGALPFHSWQPLLLERGPLGAGLLFASTHVGAYLLVRVIVPLLPDAAPSALAIIAYLGLATAVYAAWIGLVQHELRRMLGFLVISQSALVLVGLECTDVEGITGSLGIWLGAALALTGLGLCISGLEARAGQLDLRRFHGLGAEAPGMALFYLLLGLGAVGIPGSFEFVSEDLLVHGVLRAHPEAGVAVIIATALNGITVLRSFSRVFLGPRPRRRGCLGIEDLLPRERLVLVVLLLATLGAGFFPGSLIATRVPAAQRLSHLR